METTPAQLVTRLSEVKCSSPVRVSRYSVQLKDEYTEAWILLPIRSGLVDITPLLNAGGFDFLTES